MFVALLSQVALGSHLECVILEAVQEEKELGGPDTAHCTSTGDGGSVEQELMLEAMGISGTDKAGSMNV